MLRVRTHAVGDAERLDRAVLDIGEVEAWQCRVGREIGDARDVAAPQHVAHGTGSDPQHDGFLKWFSNQVGSNATSRGAYVTWEWYTGRYGTSVRLGGLDPDNSNTLDRAIVMHSADYASPAHVERWGRLGRSNGCFAFSPEDFLTVLAQLSGGRLLFADQLNLG